MLKPDEAPYPPAPWRLRGSAVIVPVPLRVANARAFLPDDVALVSAGGWTVGGVLLADYRDGATLTYHELIVFPGLVRAGRRAGPWVSHIVVDSPASVAGGRHIWGLPKGLADFTWSDRRVDVHGLLRADVRRSPLRRPPMPLASAAFGRRPDGLVWTGARGRLNAGGALVRLRVPRTSPFAALGLDGVWPAVAGDGLDLPFAEPELVVPARAGG